MTQHDLASRRDFLRGVGAAALVAGVGPLGPVCAADEKSAGGGFRVVHLSDIHLMNQRRSPAGLAACLDAVMKLDPEPAFLMTGGDQCDNLRAEDLKGATARLDLFLRIWRDHTNLPTYHCLGNHDPAGWSNKDFPRDHPQFGMKLMIDKLEMQGPYYSFDHGGWHFVVLDNIKLTTPGQFIAEFAAEQLAFLRQDLGRHKSAPTVIVCHVPPISVLEFLGGRAQAGEAAWTLPYTRVSKNPMALLNVLKEGNVKLVLSGHIHHVERIDTHGCTFICGGAVAGNWWQGPLRGCPEGFGILDCRPDGSFEYRYESFGWKASA
jgi:3',5'-cyclic AMP phosphodiesterase CpdA